MDQEFNISIDQEPRQGWPETRLPAIKAKTEALPETQSRAINAKTEASLETQLPAIKIKSDPPPSDGPDAAGGVAQVESCSTGDDDECHTPTGPENRIPEPLICPPAPKKKPPSPLKRRGVPTEMIDPYLKAICILIYGNSKHDSKRRCT